MKRFYVALFLGLALMLTGCKKNVLSMAESGKTFKYSVGESFTIRLPENASTGYVWRFKTIPESQQFLSLLSDNFEASAQGGRVGSGGEHIYVWQAVNIGTVEIYGFHTRPWVLSKDEPSVAYKIIVQ